MEATSSAKSARLLEFYARLANGEVLQKEALAAQYHVSDRSIQRDMNSLRCFLADQALPQELIYDRRELGYRLVQRQPSGLSNGEILAVGKILLDSRSLRAEEMLPLLDKLVDCCAPAGTRKAVRDLLLNEAFHYQPPHHGKPLLDTLWNLGQAVQGREVIQVAYQKLGAEEPVERILEPVGLMFSEFYFYVVGFIRNIDRKTAFENPDDLFPTIYRVDRIQSLHRTGAHFSVPYASRFEEGEFRKRVQFMYGGKLQRIRFRYTGPSIEAVLDRLPTAKIKEKTADGWIVEAEVFGKGVEMWMRSQGTAISQLEYFPPTAHTTR